MLTVLLIIAGIFAGFYALILLGAIALGWIVQPLVDGFYLNKKYRQAAVLKLLVKLLLVVAIGITLLAVASTIISLLEGHPWENVVTWPWPKFID
jgi:uncharacterized membrane protein